MNPRRLLYVLSGPCSVRLLRRTGIRDVLDVDNLQYVKQR